MRSRVLLHDFSGHPFQVELARELARRGDRVLAVDCASILTPKGAVGRREGDPPTFSATSLGTRRPIAKYSLIRRSFQELEYGMRFAALAAKYKPDVLISSNEPPLVRFIVSLLCALILRRCTTILWLQDVYGTAGADLFGSWVGSAINLLEKWCLRQADAVVVISPTFVKHVVGAGVDRSRVQIVENWAPLEEIVPLPKDNPWARARGLDQKFVLLYSGTLGRKHDIEPVLAICRDLRRVPDAVVVVISEGEGADALRAAAQAEGLPNLVQLPFQPYAELSEVLGAADVVLAFLRSEAAAYSVPSKILSYMSAGSCILAAIPRDNAASRLLSSWGAGLVIEDDGEAALLDGVRRLRSDGELRQRYREQARKAAEAEFDVELKAHAFIEAIQAVARPA